MRREKMWEGSFKMALTISEKCRNIHPSVTLAIDARAKQLRAMGHEVELVDDRINMGRAQIIWRCENGVLAAGTEPRCDGCAAAW